jgi:hypothetical protein
MLYSVVNEIEVNPQTKKPMKYSTKMVTGGTNYKTLTKMSTDILEKVIVTKLSVTEPYPAAT